ncbi:MAG: hypothetical protein ACRDTT_05435 [Pseudonocardiaceae bacterium]
MRDLRAIEQIQAARRSRNSHAHAFLGCEEAPFGFAGIVMRSVSWAGTRFCAVICPEWEEIDRRAQHGLGAITDYRLLCALSTLPHDIEVPWQAIDPVMAAILDCAPAGVVDASAQGVRLLLRPAVKLTGVYTVSKDRHALDRVGMLANEAPAGLVLRQRPPGLDKALARAVRFGLGLGLLDEGELHVLAWPIRRPRPSLNRSRLLEAIYARWCQSTGTSTPATSHQAISCFDGGSGRPTRSSSPT